MTYFGHDLLWPDLLWPRPALARPTLATTFNLANLGRFWSGPADFGQLCPPALAWPIWAMAWPIFGGQADFGQRTAPPAPDRPLPDRPKISRFFFFLMLPFSFFFSLSLGIFSCLFFSPLRVSSRIFFPLSGGLHVEFLVVFWSVGTSNVLVFALGLSCENPGAPFPSPFPPPTPPLSSPSKMPKIDRGQSR